MKTYVPAFVSASVAFGLVFWGVDVYFRWALVPLPSRPFSILAGAGVSLLLFSLITFLFGARKRRANPHLVETLFKDQVGVSR